MNPLEKVKDWIQRARQFYIDVRGEMKKVSWPARHEIVGTTVVVVIAVIFFGFYLGLVDYILARGLNRLLTYFSGTGG